MSTGELPRALSVATDAKQFALLVDAVREYAVYMLDSQGFIRTWNSGGARIKGYLPTEIIGQHFERMFCPEDRQAGKPQSLLERAARDGVCRDEGWRMRKDGSRFWASVVLTAIRDPDGLLIGFAKVSRDETERHAIEERSRQHAADLEHAVHERTRELEERSKELLLQAQELRRVNSDMEQFTYIMAHDLQEPIRLVAMYLDRLMQQGAQITPEARQRYMAYARDSAERMRLLIEDLNQYNGIDRNSEVIGMVDSAIAVRAALENLQDTVSQRQALVVTGELPRVRASLPQLTQVFQNLIGNAIKYCQSGIQPHLVIDAVPDGEPLVEFSVRDNGIGIAPEHFDRIFSVFQRLHTQEEYRGSGMGLAICKKIVERHGGRMRVTSAIGAGSTFYFSLPRR